MAENLRTTKYNDSLVLEELTLLSVNMLPMGRCNGSVQLVEHPLIEGKE